MSTEPDHLDIEISSDPTGHYVTCGDFSIRLDVEQAADLAAAILSPSVEPVFMRLEREQPGTSELPEPGSLVSPRPPTPADVRPSSPAILSSSVKPVSIRHTRSPLIDADSFPATPAEALALSGNSPKYSIDGRAWAERLSLDDEAVRSICDLPDEEWLSENAEVFYVIGRGVGMTISTDDGAVLAVRDSRKMDVFRNRRTPERRQARGRGGSGRRYPREPKQVRDLLVSKGFDVDLKKSGHYSVSQGSGPSVTISATPSDYRTTINEIKRIERTFSVSLAREA